MYEPIRTKSVHSTAAPNAAPTTPPSARAEHLSAQLAGHLAALLALTSELVRVGGGHSADLEQAAHDIAERIEQLSPAGAPVRIWEGSQPGGGESESAALHRRAHSLAGRVLIVAASRQDTATAMLACRRMDAHAEALRALQGDPIAA
jgi:hypothetical protein